MARFKDANNYQGMFITVNLMKQLEPGKFEWTVDHLVNEMDMSLFEEKYNAKRMKSKKMVEKRAA
jgi:hypothetical protein